MSQQNEYFEEKNIVMTKETFLQLNPRRSTWSRSRHRLLHAVTKTCDEDLKLYHNKTFRLRQRMQSGPEFWGSTM